MEYLGLLKMVRLLAILGFQGTLAGLATQDQGYLASQVRVFLAILDQGYRASLAIVGHQFQGSLDTLVQASQGTLGFRATQVRAYLDSLALEFQVGRDFRGQG